MIPPHGPLLDVLPWLVAALALLWSLLRGRTVSGLREPARPSEFQPRSDSGLRELADHVRGVLWLREPETGRVIYVSRGFREIWGREPEEVLHETEAFLGTVHPEDRERIRGLVTRPIEAERRVEYRVVRPGGEVRWIAARMFPVHDDSGGVYRTAGISEDVTARKELEGQLQQARQLEAVGRLAGGVAHDLNNALTTVTGLVMLLRSLPEGDDQRSVYLDEIEHAARRSTSLVQRLLAFGRKQLLQPRVVRLDTLVGELEPELRRSLGSGAELRVRCEAGDALVRVDPAQLEQVLLNLVGNARDSMAGGGRVEVRTWEAAELPDRRFGSSPMRPGPYAAIAVSDRGVGIAPGDLPRIFDPFFTTKPHGSGTGLGLPAAYGIVDQTGGWLHVESAPGAGSTFTVFLPLAEAPRAAETGRRRSAGPRSGTVLLVDDEPTIVLTVGHMLRMQGYTVLEADGGPAALRRSREHAGAIDLLLTDVMMPGMNGRELWEQLSRERPGLRVLFISGHTEDEVIRDGILNAGVAFVAKPFQMDELVAKVAEVVAAPPRFPLS